MPGLLPPEFAPVGPTLISNVGLTPVITIYPTPRVRPRRREFFPDAFVEIIISLTGAGQLSAFSILRQAISDPNSSMVWAAGPDLPSDPAANLSLNTDKVIAITPGIRTLAAGNKGSIVLRALGAYAYVLKLRSSAGTTLATISGRA